MQKSALSRDLLTVVEEAERRALEVISTRGGLKPGDVVYDMHGDDAVLYQLDSTDGTTATLLPDPRHAQKRIERPLEDLLDVFEVRRQLKELFAGHIFKSAAL